MKSSWVCMVPDLPGAVGVGVDSSVVGATGAAIAPSNPSLEAPAAQRDEAKNVDPRAWVPFAMGPTQIRSGLLRSGGRRWQLVHAHFVPPWCLGLPRRLCVPRARQHGRALSVPRCCRTRRSGAVLRAPALPDATARVIDLPPLSASEATRLAEQQASPSGSWWGLSIDPGFAEPEALVARLH